MRKLNINIFNKMGGRKKMKSTDTKYRWNISKDEGKHLLIEHTKKILSNRNNHLIDINELILLLRNNTELPPIMKHNKLKNIVNHINDNYGSIEKCFQGNEELYVFLENNKKTIIRLNDSENYNEWTVL